MCFGSVRTSPGVDNTLTNQMLEEARQARLREEERQARLKSGLTNIDSVFSGFDNNFYDARKAAYLGYYRPQIEDQFGQAKDKLTYALARNGILNSTAAADEAARLTKNYADNWASIVSKAEADANALRGQVAGEKSALIQQLNATSDADRVTNDALSRTQMMYQNRPEYNPLGDIFAGVGDAVGNAAWANKQRQLYNAYFGNTGGAGASRVVQ